jgi:hypothetical protein
MTESPEFRAARQRTPDESAAIVRSMQRRAFRYMASSVGRFIVPPVDLTSARRAVESFARTFPGVLDRATPEVGQ